MSKVRGSIERIDIPAIFAARACQRSLFSQNIVVRPRRMQPLYQQLLRLAVGNGDQIGIAFIFDGDIPGKILHQQRAAFSGNFSRAPNKLVIRGHESNVKEFLLIGNINRTGDRHSALSGWHSALCAGEMQMRIVSLGVAAIGHSLQQIR